MHIYASSINPNPTSLENRSFKSQSNQNLNQNQSHNSINQNQSPNQHKLNLKLNSKYNHNINNKSSTENIGVGEGLGIGIGAGIGSSHTPVDRIDNSKMSSSSYNFSSINSNGQSTTGGSISSWEVVRREVRIIESKLETKIQSYSWLSTKNNGIGSVGGGGVDLLHDEENPLLESEEEANLANEIEDLLAALSECNERMGVMVKTGVKGSNSALLQRYREILFDFSSEYKKLHQVFQRNREAVELYRHKRHKKSRRSLEGQGPSSIVEGGGNGNASGTNQNQYHGSTMDLLMQERRGISSSMRSVSAIISQALEITDNLTSQRESMGTSTGRMGNVNSNLPSINRMVGIIQQKKTRDNIIIGSLVGFCICFSLWYCFG